MIGIDKTSLTRSLTGCIITAYFDDYLLSVIKSVRSRPTDGKSKTRKQTYIPILYYIPFRECGFINQLDCRVCEKKRSCSRLSRLITYATLFCYGRNANPHTEHQIGLCHCFANSSYFEAFCYGSMHCMNTF